MRKIPEKEMLGIACAAMFLVSVFFTLVLVAEPGRSLAMILVNGVTCVFAILYGRLDGVEKFKLLHPNTPPLNKNLKNLVGNKQSFLNKISSNKKEARSNELEMQQAQGGVIDAISNYLTPPW